jgi:hypothetical protein
MEIDPMDVAGAGADGGLKSLAGSSSDESDEEALARAKAKQAAKAGTVEGEAGLRAATAEADRLHALLSRDAAQEAAASAAAQAQAQAQAAAEAKAKAQAQGKSGAGGGSAHDPNLDSDDETPEPPTPRTAAALAEAQAKVDAERDAKREAELDALEAARNQEIARVRALKAAQSGAANNAAGAGDANPNATAGNSSDALLLPSSSGDAARDAQLEELKARRALREAALQPSPANPHATALEAAVQAKAEQAAKDKGADALCLCTACRSCFSFSSQKIWLQCVGSDL